MLVLGAELHWFQPWKLWQNSTVRETLLATAQTSSTSPSCPSPTPAEPKTVAKGTFIRHEHSTTGTVKVIRPGSSASPRGLILSRSTIGTHCQ
ncbi:hypothetical protein [Streptomyces sp. NPDC003952]